MGCQCSNVPANVRIIRVGESEVDIIDMDPLSERNRTRSRRRKDGIVLIG